MNREEKEISETDFARKNLSCQSKVEFLKPVGKLRYRRDDKNSTN